MYVGTNKVAFKMIRSFDKICILQEDIMSKFDRILAKNKIGEYYEEISNSSSIFIGSRRNNGYHLCKSKNSRRIRYI